MHVCMPVHCNTTLLVHACTICILDLSKNPTTARHLRANAHINVCAHASARAPFPVALLARLRTLPDVNDSKVLVPWARFHVVISRVKCFVTVVSLHVLLHNLLPDFGMRGADYLAHTFFEIIQSSVPARDQHKALFHKHTDIHPGHLIGTQTHALVSNACTLRSTCMKPRMKYAVVLDIRMCYVYYAYRLIVHLPLPWERQKLTHPRRTAITKYFIMKTQPHALVICMVL